MNRRNDLMKKMKMEMVVKNCQCYCKKKTVEQQFSWSILLPTTGMKSKCWPAVRRFT